MTKPSVVFLCPALPAFSGNGLAMRAAHQLRALSEIFSVHLLVIALYGGRNESPSREVLAHCASWKRIDTEVSAVMASDRSWRKWIDWGRGRLPIEWSGWKPAHGKEIEAYFVETQCDSLWVFRFYLLPWARMWLDRGHTAWLDLDELESRAREREAQLLFRTGEHEAANRLKKDTEIYRFLERRFLSRFRRVITASAVETKRLQDELKLFSVETWPNIVSVPANGELPAGKARAEWKLLFIGSLGHFPNREAIRFAAQEILPRLQGLVELPVKLCVAGTGADAHRAFFDDLSRIEWLGTVPDVAPIYAEADIVIVPLHAGGGTRIKILEAFAHRKAVVSTSIGAEGLEVVHDRELLLADGADEMATACAELLRSEEKRERLAAAGHAFVTAHHGERNLREKVALLLRDLPPATAA